MEIPILHGLLDPKVKESELGRQSKEANNADASGHQNSRNEELSLQGRLNLTRTLNLKQVSCKQCCYKANNNSH